MPGVRLGFVATMLLAGCSDTLTAGTPSYAQALEDRVERHEDACEGANDAVEVRDETDGYDEDVRVWADDVAECRLMMGMRCCCCGPGEVELSDAVVVEVARHRDAVSAAERVEDAQEECRDHGNAMRTILATPSR